MPPIFPPHALLVNPWIHDFSAYDVWAKPLGLMILAGLLRHHGMRVSFADCLDRFHPKSPIQDPSARYGRGPYLKTRIPKPVVLNDMRRHFSRYGILPQWLEADLRVLPKPDVILVTSHMTYWYTGIQETVSVLRNVFPGVPIILGGIYATLLTDHARRYSGADKVIPGDGAQALLDGVSDITGFSPAPQFDPHDPDTYPLPAWDLMRILSYMPILTSRGCPFSCAYCASRLLSSGFRKRLPERVVEEIRHWHERFGVRDFVFYDDALLVDFETHAGIIFESVIRAGLKVRFHTPNAVHIRGVTEKTARLMARAGCHTLRLGLETTVFDGRSILDHKVSGAEYQEAVIHLKGAGFSGPGLGAYLLVGLPDQTVDAVRRSIQEVKANGVTPLLAYYSPIPGTALWERARAVSRFDLEADPLFSNNTLFPCWPEGISPETLTELKRLASV